jgi:hypothetical protein
MQISYFIRFSILKFFLLLLFISNVSNLPAQTKINEGIIIYSVTSWDKHGKEIFDSIYPKAIAVYFKDSMERIEENDDARAMGFITIINTKNNNFVTLIDSNGKKEGIITKNEDNTQERGIQRKKIYKELPDTAIILDYLCKKIQYPDPSGFGYLYIYYTDDLNIPILDPVYLAFDEFTGFALQLEEDTPDFHIIYTVEIIRNQKVEDSKFDIPSDYHIIDQYGNEGPNKIIKSK